MKKILNIGLNRMWSYRSKRIYNLPKNFNLIGYSDIKKINLDKKFFKKKFFLQVNGKTY